MRTNKWLLLLASGALPLALSGCDYSSPTDPGAPPGAEGAIVSITSSGVNPKTVTIAAGQSVTFVNNDSVAHSMASGPFPSYDDCPSINRVGQLEPGQRMLTGALTATRSCGYLDLLRSSDARWQGTINVQ